jgi:hypothetical protein
VKEEICDENTVLPCFNNKVVCWVSEEKKKIILIYTNKKKKTNDRHQMNRKERKI